MVNIRPPLVDVVKSYIVLLMFTLAGVPEGNHPNANHRLYVDDKESYYRYDRLPTLSALDEEPTGVQWNLPDHIIGRWCGQAMDVCTLSVWVPKSGVDGIYWTENGQEQGMS
jgi:hypothetical protein